MKNKLQAINTPQYGYVLVDDSEIKEGDYIIHGKSQYPPGFVGKVTNIVISRDNYKIITVNNDPNGGWLEDISTKLIATSTEHKIEGVLQYVIVDNTQKLATEYVNSEKISHAKKWNTKQFFENDLRDIDLKGKDEYLYKKLLLKLLMETSFGYQEGFKAAKEKYPFSEEDMKKCIKKAQEYTWTEGTLEPTINFDFDEYDIIQSLKQPTLPEVIEVEYEDYYVKGNYQNKCSICGEIFNNTDKLGFVCPNHAKPKLNSKGLIEIHL